MSSNENEVKKMVQDKFSLFKTLLNNKLAENSPTGKFLNNAPTNAALALATVPMEVLALREIFYYLDNLRTLPSFKPPRYFDIMKSIGFKGLFAGFMSRTSYVLIGNFATLQGINYFGSDFWGLFQTTLAKNLILPCFLVSNARQISLNFSQTYTFVCNGLKDPVVHSSFFLRNWVASSCFLPGFWVRDYAYQSMDETDTKIPTVLGLGTAVFTSTLMNAFLKPMFTGSYSVETRFQTAMKMPAIRPLMLRELASLSLVFFNLPEKTKAKESLETAPSLKP